MILMSEENITASLQSSSQTKIRIPTPLLVSSDCVGNISSPVQDLQPLTLLTNQSISRQDQRVRLEKEGDPLIVCVCDRRK